MLAVSPRPETYRHALRIHNECGPYQIRAILNTYGKDALPETLYFAPFMRAFDWSLPFFVPAILSRYGIRSSWHVWWRGSFKRKVVSQLMQNRPVMFVVNSILGTGQLHWITIWGYDDATDEFLCYDSQAPEASGTVGNVRYSAALLNSRLPWRGTFSIVVR